jgi:hypothetical protein
MDNTQLAILLIFILIWGVTDRIREIAVFKNWISRFGGWFDEYFTPGAPRWYPFRDGYHTFKLIPIMILAGGIWYIADFWHVLYLWAAWGLGQRIGLAFKKDKHY